MAKKEMNPAMRAAREQKKKEKARNKKQRQEKRDKDLVKKDPLELKREIALLKGDIANNTGMFEEREKNVKRSRVEFLESMLKKREIIDAKRAEAASQQEKQEPMFNLKGILPQSMRQADALQIEDKGAGSDDEPSEYKKRRIESRQGQGGDTVSERRPREWSEDAEDEDAAALGYFDPNDVGPTQQKDADGWVPPMPAEAPRHPADLPPHLIAQQTAAAAPRPMVRRFEVCEAGENEDGSGAEDLAPTTTASTSRSLCTDAEPESSSSQPTDQKRAVAAAAAAKLPPGVGNAQLKPPGPPPRTQQRQPPGPPLQPGARGLVPPGPSPRQQQQMQPPGPPPRQQQVQCSLPALRRGSNNSSAASRSTAAVQMQPPGPPPRQQQQQMQPPVHRRGSKCKCSHPALRRGSQQMQLPVHRRGSSKCNAATWPAAAATAAAGSTYRAADASVHGYARGPWCAAAWWCSDA